MFKKVGIASLIILLIFVFSFGTIRGDVLSTNDYEVVEQNIHDDKYDLDYGYIDIDAFYGSSFEYSTFQAVYSDDVFFRPTNVYNHFLARMSIGLAMASVEFVESQDNAMTVYSYLQKCGFTDIKRDDQELNMAIDIAGTLIGKKEVERNGDKETIIVVAIRGGKFQREWLSNVTVGDSLLHEGFAAAADVVTKRVLDYLETCELSDNFKLWITGYSRSAAIANISAANLNLNEKVGKDKIYAYTFATPLDVRGKIDDEAYDNIFNVLGATDPVAVLAPADWGFNRYGVDLYLPGEEYNSDFSRFYSLVQREMEEKSLTTYYNVDLNLRLRLFIGYLLEFAKNSSLYVRYVQADFIDLISQKSVSDFLVALKAMLEKIDDKVSELEIENLNKLIDYVLGFVLPAVTNKGFVEDKLSSTAASFTRLFHEHYPELYAYMLYDFDEEELFTTNNSFAYVLLDKDASYTLLSLDEAEVIMEIALDGEVTLSDYAKNKSYEYSIIKYKTYDVLVLPFDLNYELRFENSGTNTIEVKTIVCGRFASEKFNELIKRTSEKEGIVFRTTNNEIVLDSTLEEKVIETSEFAKMLEIDHDNISLPLKTFIIVVLVVIALSIIPILIYLFIVIFRGEKFRKLRVLSIILLAIICLEDEVSYWLFSYNELIYYLWKSVLVFGIILALLLIHKNSKTKITDTLVPFTILGVISIFFIDKNLLVGIILIGLAATYLTFSCMRGEHLNKLQIATLITLSLLLEVVNIYVIFSNLVLGIIFAYFIPIILCATVTTQDIRLSVIAILFAFAFIALFVFVISPLKVLPHLLFKTLLFIALSASAFVRIDFSSDERMKLFKKKKGSLK